MKALIIGDILLDKYVYGRVDRKSPENPSVPVLSCTYEQSFLGGCGNVAKNLKALEVEDVEVASIIDDTQEDGIYNLLAEYGIGDLYGDFLQTKPDFIEKKRVIHLPSGNQIVRIDNKEYFNQENVEMLHSYIKEDTEALNEFDCIIFSDYKKGCVNEDIARFVFENYQGIVFVDTKQPELSCWECKENLIMKINSKEYLNLLAKKGYVTNILNLIVTYGSFGCSLFKHDQLKEKFRLKNPVKKADVVGAGDCFLAGLAKEYGASGDLNKAIRFANKVASKSVEKKGTSTVFLNEVKDENY